RRAAAGRRITPGIWPHAGRIGRPGVERASARARSPGAHLPGAGIRDEESGTADQAGIGQPLSEGVTVVPPFRRVESRQAGPTALGILVPPGPRTPVIL